MDLTDAERTAFLDLFTRAESGEWVARDALREDCVELSPGRSFYVHTTAYNAFGQPMIDRLNRIRGHHTTSFSYGVPIRSSWSDRW